MLKCQQSLLHLSALSMFPVLSHNEITKHILHITWTIIIVYYGHWICQLQYPDTQLSPFMPVVVFNPLIHKQVLYKSSSGLMIILKITMELRMILQNI